MTCYEALLRTLAAWHTPHRSHGQYRSIVGFTGPQERALAETYAASVEHPPQLVDTRTAQGRFWDAEDYHQKHRLRRDHALVAELQARCGPRWDEHALATKLNGSDHSRWLAGLPRAAPPGLG